MIKGSALPLIKGQNKVTTGTFKPEVVHCDADGDLTVTWLDATTSTESFVAGEDRDTKGRVTSVAIVSGTFSFGSRTI